jgi:transmembrane sensor
VKATRETSDVLAAASLWCVKLRSGALSPDDQASFDEWHRDPENQRRLDDALGVWSALEEVAASPAMIDTRSDALRDFRKAQAAAAAIRYSRRRIWGGIAATLVVGTAAAGGWQTWHRTTYETVAGERRIVALEDGSKLALDGDTMVRVKYAGGQRRLWLERGRAKFTVAKDPLHPFSVMAGEKTIVATGTEFSVERVAQQVRVVLYEGHVAVLSGNENDLRREPVRIVGAENVFVPGQELITAQGFHTAKINSIEPTRAVAWEDGRLVFDNEPLALAVARVNRYTQTKIRIGPGTDPDIHVSGIFKAGDTPAFVDGISTVSNLRYRLMDGQYIIESREN